MDSSLTERRQRRQSQQLLALSPQEKNALLRSAVSNGDLLSVKLLIDAGADVDARGPDNLTLLMVAVIKNRPECITLLRVAGANVNLTADLSKIDIASL